MVKVERVPTVAVSNIYSMYSLVDRMGCNCWNDKDVIRNIALVKTKCWLHAIKAVSKEVVHRKRKVELGKISIWWMKYYCSLQNGEVFVGNMVLSSQLLVSS